MRRAWAARPPRRCRAGGIAPRFTRAECRRSRVRRLRFCVFCGILDVRIFLRNFGCVRSARRCGVSVESSAQQRAVGCRFRTNRDGGGSGASRSASKMLCLSVRNSRFEMQRFRRTPAAVVMLTHARVQSADDFVLSAVLRRSSLRGRPSSWWAGATAIAAAAAMLWWWLDDDGVLQAAETTVGPASAGFGGAEHSSTPLVPVPAARQPTSGAAESNTIVLCQALARFSGSLASNID
jgi:hypothetical protein